jgi:hypothetical protein
MTTEKKPETTPKASSDRAPKKKLVKYKFQQDTLTTGLSDYGLILRFVVVGFGSLLLTYQEKFRAIAIFCFRRRSLLN